MGSRSQREPELTNNQRNLGRMETTVLALRFPNGKFLGDWQYSQGYLDHEEVVLAWNAHDFNAPNTSIDAAKVHFPNAVEVSINLVAEIRVV